MPIEIAMAKQMDGSFRPVTEHDQQLAESIKQGSALKFVAVKMSRRSIQYHRLYFGGLINLAKRYWSPTGGLITESEKDTLLSFADWLDGQGAKTGAIRSACRQFLINLRNDRAEKIALPDATSMAMHRWVKEQAGYWHWEQTPTGMVKVVESINFNAMTREEYDFFYKAAFSVIWNFILSRAFKTEQDAENAVQQLMRMG